jgi:hypothetical protein
MAAQNSGSTVELSVASKADQRYNVGYQKKQK